jgi:molybdopterin-guanine dinucleotide biosynthesis protein A
VGGRTLLDRVLAVAASVAGRLVVAGPPRPLDTERAVLFVQEDAPGGGPVPAVAAALDATGGAAVVVLLAVDLPFLTAAALSTLVDGLSDPSLGVVAASDPSGRPNPLLAAYRADALRAAVAAVGQGAAGAAAGRLLPAAVAVVDLGPEATLNVNTPDDLARAAELARAAVNRGPVPGPPAAAC